jgi:hypothetical protein
VVEDVRRALLEGRCSVPAAGLVVAGRAASLPFVVMDADGREVESVSTYLRDLALGDASRLTCRSYAFDLLRWHRQLWLSQMPWEKATEAEVAALVGWLRQACNPQRRRRSPDSSPPGSVNLRTGKPSLPAGYAPRTINHALTVISGYYSFHSRFGAGPVLNPVPVSTERRRAKMAARAVLSGEGGGKAGRHLGWAHQHLQPVDNQPYPTAAELTDPDALGAMPWERVSAAPLGRRGGGVGRDSDTPTTNRATTRPSGFSYTGEMTVPPRVSSDDRCETLAAALAEYRNAIPDSYDEVLREIIGRAVATGTLGKSDLGALLLWKRIRVGRWATDLMGMAEVEVRGTIRKAVDAARGGQVVAAATVARQYLRGLPGMSAGDAFASAVIFVAAPDRMAVYDYRAHLGLWRLGLRLQNQPARYGKYMGLVEQIRQELHTYRGQQWTARDVDLALYWYGKPDGPRFYPWQGR